MVIGGGAICYEYRLPTCSVVFTNSYAYQNNAMFAGVLDFENWDSLCIVQESVFAENVGFIFELSAGGGNTIMVKGNSGTLLITRNILVIDAGYSLRGFPLSHLEIFFFYIF